MVATINDVVVVVNPEDRRNFKYFYRVSLHNYDPFFYLVYANHAQHALDQVANYLYTENELGYFVNGKDYSEDEIVRAGCRGHSVLVEHTHIQLESNQKNK